MRKHARTVRANAGCEENSKVGVWRFGREGSWEVGSDAKIGDNAKEENNEAHDACCPSEIHLRDQSLKK
jgi:hypothetical protein